MFELSLAHTQIRSTAVDSTEVRSLIRVIHGSSDGSNVFQKAEVIIRSQAERSGVCDG